MGMPDFAGPPTTFDVIAAIDVIIRLSMDLEVY